MTRDRALYVAGVALAMVGLGASDSLKGVFSPVLARHFTLTNSGLSGIVAAGYLGNLAFLLIGGKIADRLSVKGSILAALGIWAASLLAFSLVDSYILFLACVFVAMGASTLANTQINLATPSAFPASPALVVNFLFFTQGIGTSGSQALAGRFASGFGSWRIANLAALAFGVAGIAMIVLSPRIARAVEVSPASAGPSVGQHGRIGERGAPRKTKTMIAVFAFLFGLYFIAEHGILNWLVVYATGPLSLPVGVAANYLAAFFGGIMAGRLLLSPLVDRMGVLRAIRAAAVTAALLYVAGVAGGARYFALLSASGFALAIVYPTMVLALRFYFPIETISGTTGLILSIASLADIAFNLGFGALSDRLGLRLGFLAMPSAMVAFAVCFSVFSIVRQPATRTAGPEKVAV